MAMTGRLTSEVADHTCGSDFDLNQNGINADGVFTLVAWTITVQYPCP